MEHCKSRFTASNHHTYNTKIITMIKSRTRTDFRPKITHLGANILYLSKNISKLESVKRV